MRARALPLVALAACGGAQSSAHVEAHVTIKADLVVVPHEAICVTKGSVHSGVISEPTVRAFAHGHGGDAAELRFTYGGNSDTTRALASGELRRQVGIKLRAQNTCNVVYVMWRLDPRPALEVQLKRNPGMRTHAECGASGYTKVKPLAPAPDLVPGASHVLRAAIQGDVLTAWIDGAVAWQGELPPGAREIHGPAGLRSDNVKLLDVTLSAPRPGAGEPPAPAADEDCKSPEMDD